MRKSLSKILDRMGLYDDFKYMCVHNLEDGVRACVRVASRVRISDIYVDGIVQMVCVCVCARARARAFVCACVWALTQIVATYQCNEMVDWEVFSYDKLCQLNSLLLTFYILHIRMTNIKTKLKLS